MFEHTGQTGNGSYKRLAFNSTKRINENKSLSEQAQCRMIKMKYIRLVKCAKSF